MERRVQADGGGGLQIEAPELDMGAYEAARQRLMSYGLDFSQIVEVDFEGLDDRVNLGRDRWTGEDRIEYDVAISSENTDSIGTQMLDAQDQVRDSVMAYDDQLETAEEIAAFRDLIAEGAIRTDVALQINFNDAANGPAVDMGYEVEFDARGEQLTVETNTDAETEAVEQDGISSLTFRQNVMGGPS